MKRIGKLLVATLLVLPVAAQAQRPGSTMQTRSSELYLDRAEKNTREDEKAKLFAQALEMATKGVQADAGNSKTWFVLGKVYAATGDAIGADTAFTKAETMWPEYKKETEVQRVRAYVTAFNAGIAALQTNDIAGAIKHLEAASAVYHRKPAAALNLGNLYARAEQADKSAAAYRQAIEIMRGPERKGLTPEEEKQWAEWEEAASFNLAQVLAQSNKDEEAAQAYLAYLERNPDNITALSNLAIVYTRMGKTAEAQKIYTTLLAKDISEDDYFMVGVGLFRGEQYGTAAEAFRKAIGKNPALRDAYYNLAQAVYTQITDLEDTRAKATPAQVKELDAKMRTMYQELIDVASKARELDPNNRNVLALLARGYRGMADVVDPKTAMDWKNKTLEVLKLHQDLPYEVTDVELATSKGETKLSAKLVNLKGTEGQPVKITVSVLGKDGKVLGTQDVTVTAPAAEGDVAFHATFKTTEPVGGWKYEIGK